MSTFFHLDSRWRDRSKDYNTNPAEFQVEVDVADKWRTLDRSVLAVTPHCGDQVTNMVHSISLLQLQVPWNVNVSYNTTLSNASNAVGNINGSGLINLEAIPYLYVSFRSTSMYNDKGLINTMDISQKYNGIDTYLNETPYIFNPNIVDPHSTAIAKKVKLTDAVFVAYLDKVQGFYPNSSGNIFPKFATYKCNMTQTYRINQKDSLKFRVFTPDGVTLPIVDNPYPQPINPLRQVNALFSVTPYVRDDKYSNHLVSLDNSQY